MDGQIMEWIFRNCHVQPDGGNILRIILQWPQAGKNIARGSIFQEEWWHPIAGSQVEAWSEQQEVEECRLIHRPRDRRWRIHFKHTVIDHNWFIELCSGPIRLDEAPETRSKGWSCICLDGFLSWAFFFCNIRQAYEFSRSCKTCLLPAVIMYLR
jgi:hypothetical protein